VGEWGKASAAPLEAKARRWADCFGQQSWKAFFNDFRELGFFRFENSVHDDADESGGQILQNLPYLSLPCGKPRKGRSRWQVFINMNTNSKAPLGARRYHRCEKVESVN